MREFYPSENCDEFSWYINACIPTPMSSNIWEVFLSIKKTYGLNMSSAQDIQAEHQVSEVHIIYGALFKGK